MRLLSVMSIYLSGHKCKIVNLKNGGETQFNTFRIYEVVEMRDEAFTRLMNYMVKSIM